MVPTEPESPLYFGLLPVLRILRGAKFIWKKRKFLLLVKKCYFKVGDKIFTKNIKHFATILDNGSIKNGVGIGSIHQIGAIIKESESCNGWMYWCYNDNGKIRLIDEKRKEYRIKNAG